MWPLSEQQLAGTGASHSHSLVSHYSFVMTRAEGCNLNLCRLLLQQTVGRRFYVWP